MRSKKLQSFSVWARLHIDATINIEAESMADALERAKELDEHDFVKILGVYIEGKFLVYGVLENLPSVGK